MPPRKRNTRSTVQNSNIANENPEISNSTNNVTPERLNQIFEEINRSDPNPQPLEQGLDQELDQPMSASYFNNDPNNSEPQMISGSQMDNPYEEAQGENQNNTNENQGDNRPADNGNPDMDAQLDQMMADLNQTVPQTGENEPDIAGMTDEELESQLEQELKEQEQYEQQVQSGDDEPVQTGNPYEEANPRIYTNGTPQPPDPNLDQPLGASQFMQNPYAAELGNNQPTVVQNPNPDNGPLEEPLSASQFNNAPNNSEPQMMQNVPMDNPYEEQPEENVPPTETDPVNETSNVPTENQPGDPAQTVANPYESGEAPNFYPVNPNVPNPYADRPTVETPINTNPFAVTDGSMPETPTPEGIGAATLAGQTPGNETPGNTTPTAGNGGVTPETPTPEGNGPTVDKPRADGFPTSVSDGDGPTPDMPNPFADPTPSGNNPTANQPRADGFPTSASDGDGPVQDVPNPFAGDLGDPYSQPTAPSDPEPDLNFPSAYHPEDEEDDPELIDEPDEEPLGLGTMDADGSNAYYGAWQDNLYNLYGASATMDRALNSRNQLFAAYLQPDPRTGQLRRLGSADIGNLMAAEQGVLSTANQFLSRPDIPNDIYRRNLMSIRNTAGANLNALRNTPPDGSATLGQVMTNARMAHVNISPASLQRFGNGMPQNMSMQLQDGRGNQIRGMFGAGDPMAFANQNAMSQMSRMFNCGSIMAQSYPLMLQAGGVTITGNFTRYVPGSMPGNTQMNDPYFMSNPGMYTNTPALRSAANLNALDYICGTNGRGPEDMTYRFGANGNFSGVCGMGTNQAFLQNPPMGLNCVPMVGSNMASAMSMSSPAMVSYNMFNYGMSPDASMGVVSRMNQMMDATMAPPQSGAAHIQIVLNGDWSNVNLNITVGMMPPDAPANAFSSLNYVSGAQMPYMQQHALQQKLAPHAPALGGGGGPSYDMPNMPAGGGMDMGGGDNYASLLADVHELNRALSDASMVSGSKEYGNVREYAKYIEQELKGMQGNMAGPIAEKDEFMRDHVKEMMGNLRDLSEAYLERRGVQTKEKPSNKALIRDSIIRSAHALGSSRSDQRGRSSESIFSESQQRDMYENGMKKERTNAFKNMDPKEVGKLIKRTTQVGNWLQKGHPNVYSTIHNEAQTLLTKYLNNVKDKSPAEVGLTKKDMAAVKTIGVNQKNAEKTKAAEKTKTAPQEQKQAPKKGGPAV